MCPCSNAHYAFAAPSIIMINSNYTIANINIIMDIHRTHIIANINIIMNMNSNYTIIASINIVLMNINSTKQMKSIDPALTWPPSA